MLKLFTKEVDMFFYAAMAIGCIFMLQRVLRQK